MRRTHPPSRSPIGLHGLLLAALVFAQVGESSGQDLESDHPATADPSLVVDTAATAGTNGAAPEEILMNLRMGRLSQQLTQAVLHGGNPLLPASVFLSMAEIRFHAGGDGILEATRQPGAISIVVDAPSRRIWYDGVEIPDQTRSILWWNGEVFLAVRLLESILDLTIHSNLSELHAIVLNPEVLPLGRRLEREERWRSIRGEGPRPNADLTLGRTPYRTGGFVIDWSASADLDDVEGTTLGSLSGGGQFLGGSLQLSARSVGPLADGRFDTGATYHLAWPERSILRQLRLGDGIGSGPRPRSMRGIHLTNSPYVRDTFFGTGEFSGRLGPGWDIELRQHGRTIDMTRSDEQGAFALDVPLSYGNNPLEVVAYGAHGEVVTMERLMLLRENRLPGGMLEWGLSGGECGNESCLGTGNLDLRYGLSDRWTLRGGAEGFVRDSLPDVVLPYLELSGSLIPSTHLTVEALHDGFLRGVLDLTPSPGLRIRGAYTHFSSDVEDPVLHHARRRSTAEGELFVRPFGNASRWSFRTTAVHERMELDRRLRWQAINTLRVAGVRLDLGVRDSGLRRAVGEEARDAARGTLREVVSVRTRVPFLPTPTRAAPWLQGETEFARLETVTRGRVRLSYPITRSTQLDVTGDWFEGSGHRLTVGLSANLDQFRSVTQYLTESEGTARTIQYAQGTVQWNEATGGVRLDSGPGVERSGVSGYVYLDENGNGRLDPGEPGLAGIRVVVEGRTVVTDENGRYTIWDLVPYEMNRVSIDPLSIPNPSWVSAKGTVDLPLAPSTFRRLDLPVVRGGEVSGRVVRRNGQGEEEPIPGIDVEIHDLLRPGQFHEVTTFSDGGFYLMGLRPGGYEIRIPSSVLAHVELVTDHPERAVVVDAAGIRSGHHVEIRLVPRLEATVSPE